jgi:hypothetical protein
VTENTWTIEWPKEKGAYWFFGQRFRDDDVKMHLVEVWQDGAGSFVYVTNGNFLYKTEGAKGQWMKAVLPEPPK